MRFSIIGAGGIGCYYAARLIEAGHAVTLVARGEHLQAMRNDGLSVNHPELTFREPVTACAIDEWLAQTEACQVDVLIVCLKAMHTEIFAQQLEAWSQQYTGHVLPLVLSLQNGVENEKYLADAVPEGLVVGGIARRIGAHIVRPGMVDAVGPAQVIFGLWPNQQNVNSTQLASINALADCFNQALIPTEVSADINKELWRKLMVNNGFNPICTLLQIETGEVASLPTLAPLIKGAMHEAAQAARADGVVFTLEEVEEMFELISTFDSIKPSMLIDREKGRPLEIEEICGVVIRGCEQQGKDAPYNRCIATLLDLALAQQ
ncbi:MAG: 2-dehydropantoate 2-reductase [Cycloclasticus sp.]|nr:2-dehydropantoate 2-reductase [Cycloclasticus sp.]MBQ0790762.1 2-dehydropantoate 2-reductase [Cycloclasticus sp.]